MLRTDNGWYLAYWSLMALGGIGAAYWVIKWGVIAALMELGVRVVVLAPPGYL